MGEKNGEANDHLKISNCDIELEQKILVFYKMVRYLMKKRDQNFEPSKVFTLD